MKRESNKIIVKIREDMMIIDSALISILIMVLIENTPVLIIMLAPYILFLISLLFLFIDTNI